MKNDFFFFFGALYPEIFLTFCTCFPLKKKKKSTYLLEKESEGARAGKGGSRGRRISRLLADNFLSLSAFTMGLLEQRTQGYNHRK